MPTTESLRLATVIVQEASNPENLIYRVAGILDSQPIPPPVEAFLRSELAMALARHPDEMSAAGDSRVTRLRALLADGL